MQSIVDSPYYKKSVELRLRPQTLDLAVAHGLFSSHEIDVGTRLLLKWDEVPPTARRILDVGCGYGSLGLAFAAIHPESTVDLLDRDALAIEYTHANAVASQVGADVFASLGYDQVPAGKEYDLIVSNIPGKAGVPVIEEFLLGAGRHLSRDGRSLVVIVEPLAEAVDRILRTSDSTRIATKIERGYALFSYVPPKQEEPEPSGFDRGIYMRNEAEFATKRVTWTSRTAWDLPEFDTLSYVTASAIDHLACLGEGLRSGLVWGPGQGHLAVAAALLLKLESIELADRDLLALLTSRLNLMANTPDCRVSISHVVAPPAGAHDIAFISIPDKLPPIVTQFLVARATNAIADGGSLVLIGRSTAVGRSLEWKHRLKVVSSRKRRGFTVTQLART